MSLIALIKGKRGASGFGFASTAEEVAANIDLTGKTVLITGVNSGLGKESARVLSKCGAHIVGTARTLDKARAACDALKGSATPLVCELNEPSSVRACVASLVEQDKKIDVILCNAGIMALPTLTLQHGYEAQFFTNYVGHYLLVTGLLDNLAADGRVVMLSSSAHKYPYPEGIQFDNLDGAKEYSSFKAYGQSKLADLLLARILAKKFEGTSKVAMAVHPGVIQTNLGRHLNSGVQVVFSVLGGLFLKSIPQGAATQVYAACHPDGAKRNGKYLVDCNVKKSSDFGQDMALAEKLWNKSQEIAAALQ